MTTHRGEYPKRMRKRIHFAILYRNTPIHKLLHDPMKKCIAVRVQLDLTQRAINNYIAKLERKEAQ